MATDNKKRNGLTTPRQPQQRTNFNVVGDVLKVDNPEDVTKTGGKSATTSNIQQKAAQERKREAAQKQSTKTANAKKASSTGQNTQKEGGYPMTVEERHAALQQAANTANAYDETMKGYDQASSHAVENTGKLYVPKEVNVATPNVSKTGRQKYNPETGKLEDTYETSEGREMFRSEGLGDDIYSENYKIQDTKEIDRQIDDLQRQLDEASKPKSYAHDMIGGQDYERAADQEKIDELNDKIEKAKFQRSLIRSGVTGSSLRNNVDELYEKFKNDYKGDFEDYDAEGNPVGFNARYSSGSLAGTTENMLRSMQNLFRSYNQEGNGTFVGGVARGSFDTAINPTTWSMGMGDLSIALHYNTIQEKIQKGQKLTADEDRFMQAYDLYQGVQSIIGGQMGRGYKAGQTTMQSIPFMLEFVINPASGWGDAAAKKTFKVLVNNFGRRALARNIITRGLTKGAVATARNITNIGAGIAMAGTTGVARTTADVINRKNGGYEYGDFSRVDENGKWVVNEDRRGDNKQKGWGEAISEAIIANSLENISEMWGEEFAPLFKMFGKGAKRMMSAVGLDFINQGIKKYGKSEFAKMVKGFNSKAHFDGLWGEYGEEVLNNVANALTVGDMTMDTAEGTGVFNLDQNIDTFLGVSIMPFVQNVSNVAITYGSQSYQLYKNQKAASQAGALTFEDRWDGIKSMIDNAEGDDLHEVTKNVLAQCRDKSERIVALNYIQSSAQRKALEQSAIDNGVNPHVTALSLTMEDAAAKGAAATDADRFEISSRAAEAEQSAKEALHLGEDVNLAEYLGSLGNTPDEVISVLFGDEVAKSAETKGANRKYDGMTISQLQAYAEQLSGDKSQKAVRELKGVVDEIEARQEAMKDISVMTQIVNQNNPVLQSILDYYNYTSAYKAMNQQQDQNVQMQVDARNQQIDDVTNADGNVVTATDKAGNALYVTAGNVVANADGTVDTEHSDDAVVVRTVNEGGGEVMRMVPISSISTVQSTRSAEEVKQAEATAIAQEAQAKKDYLESGKVAFNPGESYQATSASGKQYGVTVVSRNEDGTAEVKVDGMEGTVTVTNSDLDKINRDIVRTRRAAINDRVAQERSQRTEENARMGVASQAKDSYNIGEEIAVDSNTDLEIASIAYDQNENGETVYTVNTVDRATNRVTGQHAMTASQINSLLANQQSNEARTGQIQAGEEGRRAQVQQQQEQQRKAQETANRRQMKVLGYLSQNNNEIALQDADGSISVQGETGTTADGERIYKVAINDAAGTEVKTGTMTESQLESFIDATEKEYAPTDENGNVVLGRGTVESTVNTLDAEDTFTDDNDRLDFANRNLQQAQAALQQLEEAGVPSSNDFNEQRSLRQQYNNDLAAARAVVDHWQKVADTYSNRISGKSTKAAVKDSAAYNTIRPDRETILGRQSSNATPMQREIWERAKQWQDKLGVNVITDASQLPNTEGKAWRAIRNGQDVAGWFNVETGEAYLYIPNARSVEDLDQTVWHEVATHQGLRELMGEKQYDRFLDKIWDRMTRAERERYTKYAMGLNPRAKMQSAELAVASNNEKIRREAADEFLAHEFGEKMPERGTAKKVLDMITEFLHRLAKRLGLANGIVDAEIRNVIDSSMRSKMERSAGTTRVIMEKASKAIGGEIEMNNGSSPIRFSIRSIAEGAGFEVKEDDGEGNVAFYWKGTKYTGHDRITGQDLYNMSRDGNGTVLGLMMDDARALGTIDADTERMLWDRYADMINASLVKGLDENGGFDNLAGTWQYVGETVYHTVATNSDAQYAYSLDITRVCKKNEAVIKAISELQRQLGYGITPAQVMDIYLSTSEYNYQVPCPVCYVFSRYIRNGRYASIAVNGMSKYAGPDADTSKLSEKQLECYNVFKDVKGQGFMRDPRLMNNEQKAAYIQFWKLEMDKQDANQERNKSVANKATKISTEALDEIDKIGKQIISGKLEGEQLEKAKQRINELDAQYRAAVDVLSQTSLTSFIKTFILKLGKVNTIHEENGQLFGADGVARMPAEYALDLRLTGEAMVKYPAIQRLRKSGGAAAGKEITFVADNPLGEVALSLGAGDAFLKNPENYYQAAVNAVNAGQRKKALKKARERFTAAHKYAQQQSLRGGQRMWSWSDNIERISPDVFLNLMQLQMLGGALQSYSKQLEGIELVARMKGYVNGSLMGLGIGYEEVNPSTVYEKDGRLYTSQEYVNFNHKKGKDVVVSPAGSPVYQYEGKYYVLTFDDVTGIQAFDQVDTDGKVKKGLFSLNEELDKAGNILVGMNDIHVKAAMADPRVYFIIPWHSSGGSVHILRQMLGYLHVNLDNFNPQDYTEVQEEKDVCELVDSKDPSQGYKNIPSSVIDFWNEHDYEDRYDCGIAGGIENGRNGKPSPSQMHYRELRDAIFIGVQMPDLDKNGKQKVDKKTGKPKFITRYDIENIPEYQGWYEEIQADEFLKQAWKNVHDTVRKTDGVEDPNYSCMTKNDCKYIYPYEYWNEESTYDTADENGERYMEYCRRLGRKPKFCGKLNGKTEGDYGNFCEDTGYWKLLIDRRMYDVNGNFQPLNIVDAEDFSADLVDPVKNAEKYIVTQVADDEMIREIADDVRKNDERRYGGLSYTTYSTSIADDRLTAATQQLERTLNGEISNIEFGENDGDRMIEQYQQDIDDNNAKIAELLEYLKQPGIIDLQRNNLENRIERFESKNDNLHRRIDEIRSIQAGNVPAADVNADNDTQFRVREKPAPNNVKKAYKLMRLVDGKLYPLFIGNNEEIVTGTWYDAESPNLEDLRNLPAGVHLLNMETGESIPWEEYAAEHVEKDANGKFKRTAPNVFDVHWANDNGMRFMLIEDKSGASKQSQQDAIRRYGDTRAYYNLGVNGSSKSKTGEGGVSKYALRPGWHFGEVPSMRQIGYNNEDGVKEMRLDNQVWVEVRMSADVDYQEEANGHATGDIPFHIPEDGYYTFATNPTQKKTKGGDSENDKQKADWYVAGAFKPVRILSDSEADEIVRQYNKDKGKNIPLDFRRAGGRVFNAETMSLEDPENTIVMQHKQKQLEVILANNPADDANMPGHTWIRTVDDIKTFKEAINDDGTAEGVTPDFDSNAVEKAMNTGKVAVYSSHAITPGAFVTPSRMEAESYAGNGKVSRRYVRTSDVAWIDSVQGQYAPVDDNFGGDTRFRERRYPSGISEDDRKAMDSAMEMFTDQKHYNAALDIVNRYREEMEAPLTEYNRQKEEWYRNKAEFERKHQAEIENAKNLHDVIGPKIARLKSLINNAGSDSEKEQIRANMQELQNTLASSKAPRYSVPAPVMPKRVSLESIKGKCDSILIDYFDGIDSEFKPIMVLPERVISIPAVREWLVNKGWDENSKNSMAYATLGGFVSHWINHHGPRDEHPMDKENYVYDMQENLNNPTYIGIAKENRNGLCFIRKTANGDHYTTVITVSNHLSDGRIEYSTSHKREKAPYKPEKFEIIWGVTLEDLAAATGPSPLGYPESVGKGTARIPNTQEKSKKSSDKSSNDVENANGNVNFRRREGTRKPVFVSNAGRALAGLKQEKATPSQWLAMLQKAGGIKAGEDKWMGLSDWLNGSKEKTITKEEVARFIAENSIEVEDVRYTENSKEYASDIELDDDKLSEIEAESVDAMFERFGVPADTVDYEIEGEGYITINASPESMEMLARISSERNNESYDPEDIDQVYDLADAYVRSMEQYYESYYNDEKNAAQEEAWSEQEDNAIDEDRLNYTTEGLDNKREIALTVPSVEPYFTGDSWTDKVHFADDYTEGKTVAWSRFGETTDEEGKRVLVVDEIQSMRHQDGRENGYGDSASNKIKEAEAKIISYQDYLRGKYGSSWYKEEVRTPEETQQLKTLSDELTNAKNISPVPYAPFEKNWHELAMKRMIRLAAEEGFDKIAWTTGEQQAKRYDLGNTVKEIDKLWLDDTYEMMVEGQGRVMFILDENNNVIQSDHELITGQNIKDVFGKELSEKILKLKSGESITDVSAAIGGEGMKGFYDNILPKFVNKYCKKFGVKVGEVTLPKVEEAGRHMWSIDVNYEMADAALEGQLMFRKRTPEQDEIVANAKKNGTYMLAPNGNPTNLSEDNWIIVRTQAFKNWFGDWENDPENASKVVDENGEPMVQFHGTQLYGFTEFDTELGKNKDNVGSHFGTESQANDFAGEDNTYSVFLNMRKPYETFDFFADNFNNAYLSILIELRKEANSEDVNNIFNRIYDVYPQLKDMDIYNSTDADIMENFEDDENLEDNGNFEAFAKHRNDMVDILRDMMKAAGYDGIKYVNWYEGSKSDYSWCILRPNQIKSASVGDEMENNGDFSNDNNDIRFRKRDEEYMDAVKSGDMDKVQQMVNEAARDSMPDTKVVDNNGNPLVVYHGSSDTGFNVYDLYGRHDSLAGHLDGIAFFTSSKKVADGYSISEAVTKDDKPEGEQLTLEGEELHLEKIHRDRHYDSLFKKWVKAQTTYAYFTAEGEQVPNSDGKTPEEAEKNVRWHLSRLYRKQTSGVKDAYLYLSNPYVYNAEGFSWRNAFKNLATETGSEDFPESVNNIKERGYDGIIIKNVRDSSLAERDEVANDYIVFYPSQIKSADPVTYDDNGNVIPLSQRFNSGNDDIRFRQREGRLNKYDYFGFYSTSRREIKRDWTPEERAFNINSMSAKAIINGYDYSNGDSYEDRVERYRDYIANEKEDLKKMRSDKQFAFDRYVRSVNYVEEMKDAPKGWRNEIISMQKEHIESYMKMLQTLEDSKKFYDKAINKARKIPQNDSRGYKEGQKLSVEEVIDLIRKNNVDRGIAELTDLVANVARNLDIDIKITKQKGTAGFSTYTGKVRYDFDQFNRYNVSNQEFAGTLLHELIHACTQHYLRAYENGAELPENIKHAISELTDILRALQKDDRGNIFTSWYGLKNVHEMLAELSNPGFREHLMTKSLWQRLKDAIIELFTGYNKQKGENIGTAYDRVNAALEIILTNANTDWINERNADLSYDNVFGKGNYANELFIGEQGANRLDRAFRDVSEFLTRKESMSVAENMDSQGMDAEKIKLATGWEKGIDGKWRYEIEDDSMKFNPSGRIRFEEDHPEEAHLLECLEAALEVTDKDDSAYKSFADERNRIWNKYYDRYLKSTGKLRDFIDHPYLFDAYPQLGDVKVVVKEGDGKTNGGYNRNTNTITLYTDNGTMPAGKRTIIHEIQHAIQFIEGFAEGGNEGSRENFVNDISGNLHMLMYEAMDWWGKQTTDKKSEIGLQYEITHEGYDFEHGWDPVEVMRAYVFESGFYDEMKDTDYGKNIIEAATELYDAYNFNDYDFYRNLAGEVEARNAARRSGFNYDRRRSTTAASTEDVARDDQFKMQGNSRMESIFDKADRIARDYENDTRFRVREPFDSATVDAWDDLASSGNFLARETMVDYLTAVTRFQDFIASKNGETIADNENAYYAMLSLSSRNKTEMDLFDHFYMTPLKQAINRLAGKIKNGESWRKGRGLDLVNYVKSKHGLERNRQMAIEAVGDELIAAAGTSKKKIAQAQAARQKLLDDWYDERTRIVADGIANGTSAYDIQKELDDAAISFGADLEKDYSGLSSIFNGDDWMDQAETFFTDYEEKNNTADLWDAINKLNAHNLEKQRTTGLVDRNYVDLQQKRFDFYVPLRGFDDEVAHDVYGYLASDNKNAMGKGTPVKTAKGRTSNADNPFAAMLQIGYTSITSGNKNEAKQKLWQFVQNHNTHGLVRLNKRWVILSSELPNTNGLVQIPQGQTLPQWVEAVPFIPENATPKQIAQIMDDFEDLMEQMSQNKAAYLAGQGDKTKYLTMRPEHQEHTITLYNNGRKDTMTIIGNPRLAQAMNGLLNPESSHMAIMDMLDKLRRLMAGAFTGANAAFSFANIARDSAYANMQAFIKESPAYWFRFTRQQRFAYARWPKLMKLFKAYHDGTIDTSTEDGRLFKEFADNGGITGYTFMESQKEYAEKIAKEIEKMNSKNFMKKGWNWFFDKIEFMGNTAELINRFIIYKTSRQSGRSISRSVIDAKEITANFNRKGAGAKTAESGDVSELIKLLSSVSQYGRSFILFWNANMQGQYRKYENWKNHTLKMFTADVAGLSAIPMVLPLLNDMVLPYLYSLAGVGGDGDDEPKYFDDLTDYDRSHNICLRMPGKLGWLKVPLPPDITGMYGIGDLISGYVFGGREFDPEEYYHCFVDYISPVSINWSYEGWTSLMNVLPTALQPMAQNAMNVNFMGSPIAKRNAFGPDNDPEYQNVYSNVSSSMQMLSKFFNDFTYFGNGDPAVEHGLINFNPALAQNFLRGYLGGYATSIMGAFDALISLYNGEKTQTNLSKFPLLSRFWTGGDIDQRYRRISSRFYENKNWYDEVDARLKAYQKEAEGSRGYIADQARAQDALNRFLESEDYRKYLEMQPFMDTIGQLLEYKKQFPGDETMNGLLATAELDVNRILSGREKLPGYVEESLKLVDEAGKIDDADKSWNSIVTILKSTGKKAKKDFDKKQEELIKADRNNDKNRGDLRKKFMDYCLSTPMKIYQMIDAYSEAESRINKEVKDSKNQGRSYNNGSSTPEQDLERIKSALVEQMSNLGIELPYGGPLMTGMRKMVKKLNGDTGTHDFDVVMPVVEETVNGDEEEEEPEVEEVVQEDVPVYDNDDDSTPLTEEEQ